MESAELRAPDANRNERKSLIDGWPNGLPASENVALSETLAVLNRSASDMQDSIRRIEALERYGILDTSPEAEFDDIVQMAGTICQTPVALVSLVAENRQWFKARLGFALCETPLAQSVCAHALSSEDLLIVPDLTQDARTATNALVTGEPFIRFYAGAPLMTPDGVALGSLCVIDTVPRPDGLSLDQQALLRSLARQTMLILNLRAGLTTRGRCARHGNRSQPSVS